jgi:hypothetical protein
LVAPFYRKEVIQRYDPLLDSCLADLQMILNEEKEKARKVDLAELINLFAFDAIGRITVSRPHSRQRTKNSDHLRLAIHSEDFVEIVLRRNSSSLSK